jgi:hypothetical protein
MVNVFLSYAFWWWIVLVFTKWILKSSLQIINRSILEPWSSKVNFINRSILELWSSKVNFVNRSILEPWSSKVNFIELPKLILFFARDLFSHTATLNSDQSKLFVFILLAFNGSFDFLVSCYYFLYSLRTVLSTLYTKSIIIVDFKMRTIINS